MASRPGEAWLLPTASWTAAAIAAMTSPVTMMVNPPYRSVMCPGCQAWPGRRTRPRTAPPARRPRARAGQRSQPARAGKPADPAKLDHGDACRVPQGAGPAFGVAAGGAQPLGHQCHPHDHVAGHRRGEVKVPERRGDPGREDQHTRHLQQRQQPVGHVVGVVGRGEPGEVHPRPPQAEEDHDVARQRVTASPCPSASRSSSAAGAIATTTSGQTAAPAEPSRVVRLAGHRGRTCAVPTAAGVERLVHPGAGLLLVPSAERHAPTLSSPQRADLAAHRERVVAALRRRGSRCPRGSRQSSSSPGLKRGHSRPALTPEPASGSRRAPTGDGVIDHGGRDAPAGELAGTAQGPIAARRPACRRRTTGARCTGAAPAGQDLIQRRGDVAASAAGHVLQPRAVAAAGSGSSCMALPSRLARPALASASPGGPHRHVLQAARRCCPVGATGDPEEPGDRPGTMAGWLPRPAGR